MAIVLVVMVVVVVKVRACVRACVCVCVCEGNATATCSQCNHRRRPCVNKTAATTNVTWVVSMLRA